MVNTMLNAVLFDPTILTAATLEAYGPANPDAGHYYASARGRGKDNLLAGPFERHDDAMAWADLAKRAAHKRDPAKAPWLAYGTCNAQDPPHEAGQLNGDLGLPTSPDHFPIPAGTRPQPPPYRSAHATFFEEEDPELGHIRGWTYDGVRYVSPGRGPMPAGGVRLPDGGLLDMNTGDIFAAEA